MRELKMMQTPTQKILKAYEESQTLTGIHKLTGYNWQRIAKTLSTEGIIVNETQATIIGLHYRGKSASEISTITGFAVSTVMAYLPRTRPAYMENRSENALRIEKCRKGKSPKD
jgi:hypothetical protein